HRGERGEQGHREQPERVRVAPVAPAAEEHEELRDRGDDARDRGRDGRGEDVAVVHVHELVAEHRAQLALVEQLEQARRARARGIARVAARREGVRGRRRRDVQARHGLAGLGRQLTHDAVHDGLLELAHGPGVHRTDRDLVGVPVAHEGRHEPDPDEDREHPGRAVADHGPQPEQHGPQRAEQTGGLHTVREASSHRVLSLLPRADHYVTQRRRRPRRSPTLWPGRYRAVAAPLPRSRRVAPRSPRCVRPPAWPPWPPRASLRSPRARPPTPSLPRAAPSPPRPTPLRRSRRSPRASSRSAPPTPPTSRGSSTTTPRAGGATSPRSPTRSRPSSASPPGGTNPGCASNQVATTEERKATIAVSSSYSDATQAVVTTEDSPAAGVSDIAGLKPLKIGAMVGTTSAAVVEAAVEPDNAVSLFNDNDQAKQALASGLVDVVVFDLPTALYVSAVEIEGGKIIGQLPAGDNPDQFGLVLDLESPIVDEVSAAVDALRENGTLAELEAEWITDAAGVPVLE